MVPRRKKPTRRKKPSKQKPKPRKYRKGTKQNPIRVVFFCLAGIKSSRIMAEGFRAFLKMKGLEKLSQGIELQQAGPQSSNQNIPAIKKGDLFYSLVRQNNLQRLYRIYAKTDISPFLKPEKFHMINELTLLKALDDIPPSEVAKRVSYFYEGILRELQQKFRVKIS